MTDYQQPPSGGDAPSSGADEDLPDFDTTIPSEWQFVDKKPTIAEIKALLEKHGEMYGIKIANYIDYVQPLPSKVNVDRVNDAGTTFKAKVEAITLYMTVAGRLKMLADAAAHNEWTVELQPEPATPTGIPGVLKMDDAIFYRSYVIIHDKAGRLIAKRAGTAWVPGTDNRHNAAASNPIEKCLAPGTRVLTADLTWVGVEVLKPGDEVIGFDEQVGGGSGRGQKLRRAVVEDVHRQRQPCVRVETNRGTVTCSTDHQWLYKRLRNGERGWQSAADLKPGDRIVHYVDPWDVPDTRDAGWMAGFLDGKGHVSNGLLRFTQVPGLVRDEVERIMKEHGVDVGGKVWELSNPKHTDVWRGYVTGGSALSVRALGMFRPLRLMAKSHTCWEGARTWSKTKDNFAEVLSVTDVGEQDTVAVQTSTRTLIAEGMLSHNCETASYGRAIAALGLGVLPGSGVASLEEMQGAQANQRDAARAQRYQRNGPAGSVSGGPPVDRTTVQQECMALIASMKLMRGETDEQTDARTIKFLSERLGIQNAWNAKEKRIEWSVVKPGQLAIMLNDLRGAKAALEKALLQSTDTPL